MSAERPPDYVATLRLEQRGDRVFARFETFPPEPALYPPSKVFGLLYAHYLQLQQFTVPEPEDVSED